ncbi:hypothetical protein QBC37DRAFT_403272 [Rhypophila decipiens]|uniref:Uncharacterized protein n=1 Tax=Rhypophila decipiens TaxID=261697 RepID=A0AAN6Y3A0_9PEZI|nr:hypothetical protein QBC37DRAFT_403272 [Rhypophila decipiens]
MAVPLLRVVPADPAQPPTHPGPVNISFEIETASEISGSDMDSDAESESGWSEPDHTRNHSQTSPKNNNKNNAIPITPDTPAHWPPSWTPAWPPEVVAPVSKPLSSSSLSAYCQPGYEPIKPHPIMLAKHTDFKRITLTTPCRFKFIFPLRLPPQLDPVLVPPPPYYPPNLVSNHMDGVKKVLRPVIASALLSILGPDAEPQVLADSRLIPPVSRETSFQGTWLHDNILCHMVDDPEHKFDLEGGKWEDQCGIQGEGGIDAYQDFGVDGGGVAIYYAYEFRVDWCVENMKSGDEEPMVVFFEALPELRAGGRVAIIAEECDERERAFVNMRIRDREGWP